MKNQIYKNDTYNLYTIKTGKFKTGLLEVVFYTPYTEVRDSYISVLINMLTSENKLYRIVYILKKYFLKNHTKQTGKNY